MQMGRERERERERERDLLNGQRLTQMDSMSSTLESALRGDAANKRLEAAKEEIQALRKARDEREAQLEKASLEAARETAEMLRTEFQRGLEMGAKLATGQFAAAFASSAPAPAHAR